MNKNEHLDLEMLVLQGLTGKMPLMLTGVERENLVKIALEEVLKADGKAFVGDLLSVESKSAFIKKFLSYGIIEDLLYNVDVEDIIINALKADLYSSCSQGFHCHG